MKFDNLYTGLIRKGLITDDGLNLTLQGIELIKFVESGEKDKKLLKIKANSEDFDKWWKAFPGTDTFTYKGRMFTGSRTLRQSKDDCKIKFNKILLEGEYKAQQLIDALELDVKQKKEASIKEGTNKLKYMQNSLTYLNQRSFEPFIELLEMKVEPINETPKGTIDI